MPAPEPLPARLIGALFVERGLVSESQVRVALEIQRDTGQQLGQILVERFGVSRKELASVVADQWAKLGGTSGPEDSASWRRLGEIFVERGFVSEDELEQALTRQRQTGERLGEALVAQGVISKFELAGALAEQMASIEASEEADGAVEQPEATVHHLPPRDLDPSEVPFGAVVELDAAEAAPPEEPVADEQATGDFADTADEPGEVWAGWADVTAAAEGSGGAHLEAVAEVPEGSGEAHLEAVADFPEHTSDLAEGTLGLPEDTSDLPEDTSRLPEDTSDLPEDHPDVVPDPDAPLELEAIAIDDVGHVSLVGAAGELVEPEPPELFEDLRDAIAAEAVAADGRHPEPLPSVSCLVFAPTTDGYRLVALERLPDPGETIDVPDVGERLVLRVGRSPLPGDGRLCAYVEEPVAPAPVAALAH